MSSDIEKQANPNTAETPSVEQTRRSVYPEKKSVLDRLGRKGQFAVAGAIATGLVAGGLVVGSKLGGESNEAPEPNPNPTPTDIAPTTEPTVEPTEPIAEPTPTDLPTDIETDPGIEGKVWDVLEVPEKDAAWYRDFGSKENFLNWFKIDERYNTPELIAKKYAQILGGYLNAGLTDQYDESLYSSYDPVAANWDKAIDKTRQEYLIPIKDIISTPEANWDEHFNTAFVSNGQSLFWITLDRGDAVPYATTVTLDEYNVISGDIESGSVTLQIKSSTGENTDLNIADWRRDEGQPVEYISHYTEHVSFVYDEASESWKINSLNTITKESDHRS